ncbi:MAG: glycosyltransferase [Rhizomicrobium sp.]
MTADEIILQPAGDDDNATASGFITAGDVSRDSGDWEAARDNYHRALAINPELQHIWIQLGHARKELGDYTGAEAAYLKALDLKPDDADCWLQLGHLYKIRSLFTQALEAYMKAQDFDPELKDAHAEIDRLRERLTSEQNAQRSFTPSVSPRSRGGKAPSVKALNIVFDVSDLMHYFRNARLPTGIQRVQIEVILNAVRSKAPDVGFSIVCFTKETDFWIEIPEVLFNRFCREAVVSGDHTALEWVSLLMDLDTVLASKQYYNFARGSVLLNLGTSWWLQNYFLNVRLAKSLYGIRYVPFVHDFIPVMAPEHCVSDLRQDFITWAIGAFDHADFFLVNSKATLADLQTVGEKLGYGPREVAVITLDADFRRTLTDDAVLMDIGDPASYLHKLSLESGKYVLFVSTIESRKNHIAAFSVWLNLIKKHGIKNVPKLVCVGNPGWLNDAAYAKLRASELLSEHVLMLSKIPDSALALLYENCVCTLYPSSYEGWGLPVTEALCYGKVPIVSNVSSLPEAGGEFAVYFDPGSEKDLLETVERVVYDDEFRTQREQKISEGFRARGWDEVSAQIVDQLREWAKTAPAEKVRSASAHGVWPVVAEMGILHPLTSNQRSTLWAGLKSGEIYRNGPGWWWPEHWGSWMKQTGPSQVAFVLEGVAGQTIQVYVGIRGVQGKSSVVTVKTDGIRTQTVPMGPEQEKTFSITLPPSPDDARLVVITLSCDVMADFRIPTGGRDFRSCGIGVRWFYACRDDDTLARLRMVEALALNDFARIERQPPEKRLLPAHLIARRTPIDARHFLRHGQVGKHTRLRTCQRRAHVGGA